MTMKASLMVAIVGDGTASKILQYVRTIGITGGTIVKGEGTVASGILNMLGLTDRRREILLMVTNREIAERAHQQISTHFEMHKKDHGVLFTTKIHGVIGAHALVCPVGLREEECRLPSVRKGGSPMNYQAIFTVVDRGKADDVLAAAKKAGATGGTVLHGRGAGIHDTASIFNMTIEPEKEIIINVSPDPKVEEICDAIDQAIDLDVPGNGILFTIDVNEASGMYQQADK